MAETAEQANGQLGGQITAGDTIRHKSGRHFISLTSFVRRPHRPGRVDSSSFAKKKKSGGKKGRAARKKVRNGGRRQSFNTDAFIYSAADELECDGDDRWRWQDERGRNHPRSRSQRRQNESARGGPGHQSIKGLFVFGRCFIHGSPPSRLEPSFRLRPPPGRCHLFWVDYNIPGPAASGFVYDRRDLWRHRTSVTTCLCLGLEQPRRSPPATSTCFRGTARRSGG